jgi:hypothetical protein
MNLSKKMMLVAALTAIDSLQSRVSNFGADYLPQGDGGRS